MKQTTLARKVLAVEITKEQLGDVFVEDGALGFLYIVVVGNADHEAFVHILSYLPRVKLSQS